MTDGSEKHRAGVFTPTRNTLSVFEVAGILVLSGFVHFGVYWYFHSAPLQKAQVPKMASPPPVHVTLTKPQPKAPKIDTHAVMPPKKKKPKPKPKKKPKPKPKPEPKPTPKPQPEPTPKPSPKPAPKSKSVTPAVSGMQSLGNPPPSYPPRAMRRHEEGVVKLKILVEPNGTAGKVTVIKSSGYSELDRAAVETVKDWRFKPAHRGSKAIAGYALQNITFRLRQ